MNAKRSPAPVTDEAIGALVRAKRQESGVGFRELAEALDMSEQMLQKYETGVSALTVVKLVKIAETLGCKTLDLIP